MQVVASQDWPEVTKYAGLVCAQPHREELIQDLFKTWKDPQQGTVNGGMIRYYSRPKNDLPCDYIRIIFFSSSYLCCA